MKEDSCILFLGIVTLLALTTTMAYSQTAGSGSCENLKNLKIADTTITSAQIVPAGEFVAPARGGGMRGGTPPAGDLIDQGRGGGEGGREGGRGGGSRGGPSTKELPAFCRVIGVVAPSNNFEVWLPPASGEKKWNGKFNGVGNGGMAGSISYSAMIQALARGYATASTDTGHVDKGGDDSWAIGHPELIVDFASRSIHMTTVAAKAVSKAYYEQAPQYSYFTGCSGGGGQALSEAQRYPSDYSGIVAGAPANFPTQMWPGELYAAYVTHRNPANMIPNEKLQVITDAVLAACDSMDGVKDGLLGDPRRCNFDPKTIQCPGPEGPNCLTAAQVDSVKKVWEGLKDPTTGKQFWYGYEMSSEQGWPGHINNPFGAPLSYFKYMVFQDPNWDWKTLNFSDPKGFAQIVEASKKLGLVLDSVNPDLSLLKKQGGKLIQYHGWDDQNISPRNSIAYFESVQKAMGGAKATDDFYRLFLAPGMGHCGGGAGPNTLDALSSLEQWVEKGKAPDQIIATHSTAVKVDRSRPLCPYPLVATYKGTGSIDDAANFSCTAPPASKNSK
jgi:feruloyl esterase